MTTVEAATLVGAGVDRVDGPPKVHRRRALPDRRQLPGPGTRGAGAQHHRRRADHRIDTGRGRRPRRACSPSSRTRTRRGSTRARTASCRARRRRCRTTGSSTTASTSPSSSPTPPSRRRPRPRLVDVDYERGRAADSTSTTRGRSWSTTRGAPTRPRGDVAAALAAADVTFDATYTTPDEHQQPARPVRHRGRLGRRHRSPCTTRPSGRPRSARRLSPASFGIPEAAVRVLAPYVGGGFGAGLRVWPHVILAVIAARRSGRPVKLVLTRPEMFTGIGHRPATVQHVAIGATRDGELVAIEHDSVSSARRSEVTTGSRAPPARRRRTPARTSPPATGRCG